MHRNGMAKAILASISLVFSGSALAQPVVAAPSFETPNVGTSFQINPVVAGVTFANRAGIAGNVSSAGFASAPDGRQAAFLESLNMSPPASITHALTGLTPGASYAVRFFVAQKPSRPNSISVMFNTTSLGPPIATVSNSFVPVLTGIFTVPVGQTTGTLTFTGGPPADSACALIDMVALVPVLPAVVANPSFETPEQGNGATYNPIAPGLSFANYAGIAGHGSGFAFASASDGDQVGLVQGYDRSPNAIIAQQVSGLTPGALYSVRFFIAQRPGFGANPVTVAINGTSLGTFSPASSAFVPVSSLSFTANGTSGTLTFTGSDSWGDNTTAIDMVTVVPVPRVP